MTTGADLKPSSALEPWSPSFPSYLQDLQSTSFSDGCACSTELDRRAVNGKEFEKGATLHESYLGAVVQRAVSARSHPYHQHVYPFQLISGFGTEERDDRGDVAPNYFQKGDWHDTIEGAGVLRYKPTRFTGKAPRLKLYDPFSEPPAPLEPAKSCLGGRSS